MRGATDLGHHVAADEQGELLGDDVGEVHQRGAVGGVTRQHQHLRGGEYEVRVSEMSDEMSSSISTLGR